MSKRLVIGLVVAIVVVGSGLRWNAQRAFEAEEPAPDAERAANAGAANAEVAITDPPGNGFVVWESNRSGRWRLWIRQLDGTDLRQLTPEEEGLSHCCPHVAPDGSQIAYLSLRGRDGYGPRKGFLHLIRPDGTNDRMVGPARPYGEHRGVVWHGPQELVYIDGRGYTLRLLLPDDRRERLTDETREAFGWLINTRLTHAVAGVPTFSLYDAATRTVTELAEYGGCQPYFSYDGRWGYWTAGAGGPIDRIDLTSRTTSEILGKNDPRMPGDQRYLYFPMLSPCQRLLAFAASADQHDHFSADYDVYVAELDPERLELVSAPVRYTSHPATDRFPDVFLAPLPLGTHTGEVPFTVTLDPPGDDAWQWDLGDGTRQEGARVEHTYREAGSYAVRARRGAEALEGRVRARPARPPELLETRLRGGEVVLRFDEPVDASDARIELASGREVAGARTSDGARELVVELAAPLRDRDVLRLSGLGDRAQRPNVLPPREIPLVADRWPSDAEELLFLWQTGDAANQVFDPLRGVERSFALERQGRVRLDHAYRMDLGGGVFRASNEASEALLAGIRGSNAFTLEVTLEPRDLTQRAAIVAFSGGRHKTRNLVLEQEGRNLVVTFSTAVWEFAERRVELGRIPSSGPFHLLVGYRPGKAVAYLNGEPIVDSEDVQGDFFQWRARPLTFGGETGSGATWNGLLEGVALYSRLLGPEEARENARRYLELVERRPVVPPVRLRGRLAARSSIPTLQEITPYREALAVYEYRVEEVLAGSYSGERIRVAHWVILDGERLPVAQASEGEVFELHLEPFAANPQLEPVFLSNASGGGTELYFATGR